MTKSTVACTVCEGQGSFFSPKDKCKKCKGKKVTEETKMLEIYIPRGAQYGCPNHQFRYRLTRIAGKENG